MSPSATRRLLATVVALAIALASCSSGGSDGGERSTTSLVPTTVVVDDDPPSDAALRAILPKASDFGEEWSEQTGAIEGEDPALTDAIDAQCPALAAFRQVDRAHDVVGSYYDTSRRQLEIAFNPDGVIYTRRSFAKLIAAVNDCGEITYDGRTGTRFTLTPTAQAERQLGEQGVRLAISSVIVAASIGGPVAANSYLYVFQRGPVVVTVQGSDAVDPTTGQVAKFEPSALDPTAGSIDSLLRDVELALAD
jgi:hypothetical protein